MLIAPIRIHTLLTGLLAADETQGPHTAMLITPAGELLCHATLPEEDDEDEGEDEAGDHDAEREEGEDTGNEGANGDDAYDEDDDDEDGEPWLEGPERLRLLLGLASQWEEDESPRVECELGRLFLRPIQLPEPEVIPPATAMPPVEAPVIPSFVLVLNGTAETPWAELLRKADDFVSEWRH